MKVFLDDLRETPPGWHRTYTVGQTIEALKRGGVTDISLDHDLGEDEPSGYQVLVWLEEQVAFNGFRPPENIAIHTANGGAWERMQVAAQKIHALWMSRGQSPR